MFNAISTEYVLTLLFGILFQFIVFIFALGVGVSCCGNTTFCTLSCVSGVLLVGTGGLRGGGGGPPMEECEEMQGGGGGASGGGGGGGGGPGAAGGGGGGGGGGPTTEVLRLCFRLPQRGCL